jgi:hypothetical protein
VIPANGKVTNALLCVGSTSTHRYKFLCVREAKWWPELFIRYKISSLSIALRKNPCAIGGAPIMMGQVSQYFRLLICLLILVEIPFIVPCWIG